MEYGLSEFKIIYGLSVLKLQNKGKFKSLKLPRFSKKHLSLQCWQGSGKVGFGLAQSRCQRSNQRWHPHAKYQGPEINITKWDAIIMNSCDHTPVLSCLTCQSLWEKHASKRWCVHWAKTKIDYSYNYYSYINSYI